MDTYSQIATITASHCCICRKSLTDAESVEHGIGPLCSRRYYNPLHQPTEEMVMTALGRLATSELPPHIVLGFRNLVNNDHTNARKACNLLIYWASCHYYDRDEVFRCSAIIRDLGYTELAEKLETDRTDLTITEKDDFFKVAIPDVKSIFRYMYEIPGAVNLREKTGRKIIWTVPTSQKEHLDIILGIYLGGKLACGVKGIWKIPRRNWYDLQCYLKPQSTPQPVVPVLPVTPAPTPIPPQTQPVVANPNNRLSLTLNGKLLVMTPYNAAFKDELKSRIPWQNRVWNGVDKRWEIDVAYESQVRKLIETHFGIVLA